MSYIDFQPITARILVEAGVVGILLIIFAYIVSFGLHRAGLGPSLPEVCKSWNSGHIMELTLFLSGALFHLTFEGLGWNKMYALDKIR
jgi:hypothetical protein